jgi:cyclohexa-1,5-dienecarbonyl-CoA hydratase
MIPAMLPHRIGGPGGGMRAQLREHQAVFHVELFSPPLNVLDTATHVELHHRLAELKTRSDLRLVCFSSRIPGVFSAGNDVRDHAPERAPAMLQAFHGVLRVLDELPQVSVALVDGHCLGAGCEIGAACDIAFATPRSTFGQPEIDIGCFPPAGAALLPRRIGRAADELVLTGRRLSAEEAARVGLITRVVDDLAAELERLRSALLGRSAAALALARRALHRGRDQGFPEALAANERSYLAELLATPDAAEGVRAFLEKRGPRDPGR